MGSSQQESFDWGKIERGVPITNDSYFVRHDRDTGLIYDDQGGYIHENFCYIEKRREVTWIQHNQDPKCPTAFNDVVLIESVNDELSLTSAYEIIWTNVKRYRVIRQQLSDTQQKTTTADIQNAKKTLNKPANVALNIAVLLGAILL